MTATIITRNPKRIYRHLASLATPNPLGSDCQCERYYHHDVPYMELDVMYEELYALRPLLWGLPETHWIRERVKELETEIARRKYAKGGRK